MAPTRLMTLAALALLPLLAGGCNSVFKGEWAQTGVVEPEPGAPIGHQRGLALQFVPPSTVRYGSFDRNTGLVDPDTVQTDEYITLRNRSVAQFGSLTARIEDGDLVVIGPGSITRRLTRVKEGQIFPPFVHPPKLTASADRAAEPLADAKGPVLSPFAGAVTQSAERPVWMETK
jgi:hypothetical protein